LKKIFIAPAAFAVFMLGFTGCGKNSGVKAPLKENMTLSYSVETLYKGRRMDKTDTFRFENNGGSRFTCIHMVTDEFGTREADRLQMDGYFVYNKVLTANVGHNDIWRNPKELASGKIKNMAKLKITQGTYNGRDVYTVNWDEGHRAHYARDTGICEGYVYEDKARRIKETVKRIH